MADSVAAIIDKGCLNPCHSGGKHYRFRGTRGLTQYSACFAEKRVRRLSQQDMRAG